MPLLYCICDPYTRQICLHMSLRCTSTIWVACYNKPWSITECQEMKKSDCFFFFFIITNEEMNTQRPRFFIIPLWMHPWASFAKWARHHMLSLLEELTWATSKQSQKPELLLYASGWLNSPTFIKVPLVLDFHRIPNQTIHTCNHMHLFWVCISSRFAWHLTCLVAPKKDLFKA